VKCQAIVVSTLSKGDEVLDSINRIIVPQFSNDVPTVCLYLDFSWQNSIASVFRFCIPS
jgi:hypothetical protein